jgi:glycine cleavage system protein P-like pyridoxal-binding family
MIAIDAEARRDPEMVKHAPYSTPVRRLDETTAARSPVLRWTAPGAEVAARTGGAPSAGLAAKKEPGPAR